MGKDISKETSRTIDVAEIVYHGEKLILPENMTLKGARSLITARMEYEDQVTTFSESFNVMPWDGANALNQVLRQKFGWAQAVATPGFWGDTPPAMISIAVGPNETRQVPWGRIQLPNLDGGGYIETGVGMKNGRFTFQLNANIKRVNEREVISLFHDIREYLKHGSIYAGKAVKVRFLDDNGKPLPMPEPSFMDTSKIDPDSLIFAEDVQNAIKTNLFTPILRVADCIANKMPVKRGILLGGTYGTGKTLAATVAARHAVDAGITYVYIPRADELRQAIEFAKQYQSPACVIFCEDIDRVMNGERSIQMDDILNLLDGIDTKSANIITVLTTNAMDVINPAMLRPGRLDAVIDVTPPDAKAVERLIRHYGGDAVDPKANLTEAGTLLAGNIPAVIAEVVNRAKLSQLALQPPGEKVNLISEAAFIESSRTMASQLNLLAKLINKDVPAVTIDSLLSGIVADKIAKTQKTVDAIAEDAGVNVN